MMDRESLDILSQEYLDSQKSEWTTSPLRLYLENHSHPTTLLLFAYLRVDDVFFILNRLQKELLKMKLFTILFSVGKHSRIEGFHHLPL